MNAKPLEPIPPNSEFLVLGNDKEVRRENIWRDRHRKITTINDCYICFLDILGFKELAQNDLTNLQEILKIFTNYISGSVYKRKTNADELKRSKEPNNNNNHKLKILIISDSIIITTENKSFKALATLIDTSIDFVSASYTAGLALRGVITKSNLLDCSFMDNDYDLNMNILWGAGIAKAFQQEKSLEISGCAIDPEITVLENFLNKDKFRDYKNKIIKYKVPLKKDADTENMKTKEMYMVNWLTAPFFKSSIANPTENPPDPDLENIKKAFLKKGTIENLEASVKTKLQNTITLYNYLKGLTGNKK
ncbi:MAG: hypothetical protein ACKO3R_07500 [bacterium]